MNEWMPDLSRGVPESWLSGGRVEMSSGGYCWWVVGERREVVRRVGESLEV